MEKAAFKELENIFRDLVNIRRDLHMYPELSFEEERTPSIIANFLRECGLEIKTEVGGRGVTALLKGAKPGKTVALRADFDALPIQDEKSVPYKSKIPGIMHACGHDIHTASLLGTAYALSKVKEYLHGNVLFIHQFAEEVIPGGAKAMIEDGCLENVGVVYGAHVLSNLPVGQILFKEDYMMAAGDKFEIVVEGKGGHGSSPHLAVDPVLIGSQIVTNIQQITASRINATDPTVITVCSFDGVSRYNIIPDKVILSGTVRTFSEEARELAEKNIKRVAEAACSGAGANCVVTYEYGYPSVCNNSEEALRIKRIGEKIVGKEYVSESPLQMAMEDFSYYVREKPGAFFNVGGMNAAIEAVYPHHHPKFDVDEQSILIAGKMFISLVFDYLNSAN
ncbi:amidohydrolase [Bacillus sp. ISL-40]|uniref:M20 metallopeptidase family protein n=1 Tax=unclassified Bacillus (in: firmicutes) TaxID=185979 RepID=UPI001BEBCD37|nr:MULTISPECIES: amidohydrolase [unclassified Bacillus (in: firmicutes)]MBT2698982.1 amidohydrolase [Bacillus sp. ISL-40]MBT2742618.1 amidohydrolase [Bacillus sp. ISL-77]